MNTKFRFSAVLSLLTVLFTASALAAAEMPRLQFGHGDVKAVSLDGKTRPLKKGDVLLPGEKLVTGPGAMAQLRLFQQGVVVLRDDSQLELKPEVDGRYGVALDKGLLRTVTKLGFRLGKIDVDTPVASIAVQSGDMLTGVGVDKSARTTTHSHVFDGLVKIKTSSDEKTADVGKIFQINPIGGAITTVAKTPASMKLTLPPPSQGGKAVLDPVTSKSAGRVFDSDMTKIAVLKPDAPVIAGKPQLNVPSLTAKAPIAGPGTKVGEQVFKVNFDAAKVYDPRIDTGLPSDKQIINNALVVSIPSSISKTRDFAPVITQDPVVRQDLAAQATVVKLTPTTKVAGETTLSSPVLPIKVVTFEPEKIIETSPTFNESLVKTIDPTITKTTTTTTTTIKEPITTIKTPTCTTRCFTLLP